MSLIFILNTVSRRYTRLVKHIRKGLKNIVFKLSYYKQNIEKLEQIKQEYINFYLKEKGIYGVRLVNFHVIFYTLCFISFFQKFFLRKEPINSILFSFFLSGNYFPLYPNNLRVMHRVAT